MIYFSFSLYGTAPKYTRGAVENAIIIAHEFPAATAVFHVADDVPTETIAALEQIPCVRLIHRPREAGSAGMFWRFLTYDEPDCEVMFVRDIDSRIHARDISTINDFLASKSYFHVVRDHKFHRDKVMGCSFAIRKNDIVKSVSNMLKLWNITPNYGNDQQFLASMIYPKLFRCMMVQDRYETQVLESRLRVPFSVPITDRLFVGQVHDYDTSGNEYLIFDS